ncbi:MAG: ABC transporter ATP-binding protein [Anaerolineaceae bacterium]
MGFFEGLDAEKYDRKYQDRDLVKRILHYFKPERGKIILVSVMTILISLASASSVMIISKAVDWLKDDPKMSGIILISSLAFGIGFFIWIANWIARRTMVQATANVVMQLASDGFQAAENHDLSFYDEYSSGRIVSRITTDTQDFGQLITVITDVASQLLEVVVLGIVLVGIEWRLSLMVFVIMPVVFIIGILFRQLARKATQQGMRAMANVNSTIKETISGISVAKNFRQEKSIYDAFNEANTRSYQVNWRRGFVLGLIFPLLNALAGVATAVMVYVGGLSVTSAIVTAGSWYLFLLSLDRFLFPVMNISAFWSSIQNGLSASERVFALIDAEPAVVQMDTHPVSSLKGQIDFQNVSFYYKKDEGVLENLTLHIKPRENLALVGHTGAGKSSVAKLIARFYEFQSGSILIDGKDIRTFDLAEYRKHLGIVSQVPFLFSGTVLANIRYTRQDATESEIINLAKQIGDGEWLETLPDGLQTEVGERGARLSMGQRQLVSLMRVLVQRPEIFILDEATASIDPFTEWQIQQALNLILERSTSILIAHRLSTVKSADRIIVMENGKVIEEGNHQGLLENGGHYATLYNTYFRHQSLEYVEKARELVESGG